MKCGHIMVVEDDEGVRETLRDLLELEGFRVFAAENGREGLQLLQSTGEPCLILLDLMMPVMSGWEFLEALKEEHPRVLTDTRVAVVSAAADVIEVQQEYGCPVLNKPLNIERLLELARERCEGC